MTDSFSQLKNAAGANRPVVVGGIIVLLVALAAAVIAGWIALSDDQSAPAPPTQVTVTATPETPGFSPDNPPEGTYVGELTSLADDTQGERWQAVATFGGGSGMITYPDQGCAVSLKPKEADTYSSTALTRKCTGTEGSWVITTPESGLVDLVYLLDGKPIVEGTLSLGFPVHAQ
ncbi:hypothetical protein QP027_03705 [Corynebacterium breve]|uniref:Uncharacterized protein n=1 Tax=Corynebacterium breve TaxID=3049799 RepID=A0ABY8VHF4_9CORY|nr:hypothetical protein [Corynebacterium breve]WIM68512.1 hypothetical protein QP027_03705 [Corynebacterium breve]